MSQDTTASSKPLLYKTGTGTAIAGQLGDIAKRMKDFNLFFVSGNEVQKNARVSVPTAEWEDLNTSFLALKGMLEQALAAQSVPNPGVPGVQTAEQAPMPFPHEAIGKMLSECMDAAVKNGADSRSMPDDYVAVSYLLAFPDRVQPHHGAAGVPSPYHAMMSYLDREVWQPAYRAFADAHLSNSALQCEKEPTYVAARKAMADMKGAMRVMVRLEQNNISNFTAPEAFVAEEMVAPCTPARRAPESAVEEGTKACWNCRREVTPTQRMDNDGLCPFCHSELAEEE